MARGNRRELNPETRKVAVVTATNSKLILCKQLNEKCEERSNSDRKWRRQGENLGWEASLRREEKAADGAR